MRLFGERHREETSGEMREASMGRVTQGNLFDADLGWARAMRSQYRSGEVRELGLTAHQAYLCIKAHADLENGISVVSEPEIASMLGVSVRTVQRAICTLEQRAYLTRIRKKKGNAYQLREKITIRQTSGDGEQAVIMADMPYLPKEMTRFFEEIQAACKAGQLTNTYNVTFVLNQNNVCGDHNTVINNTAVINSAPDALQELPQPLREAMQRLEGSLLNE